MRSARSPGPSTRCTPRRCGWRATRPCSAPASTRCSSTCPGAARRSSSGWRGRSTHWSRTRTTPTGCPACSRWTTWSPACAATRRTCCCWPAMRARASGATRCRSRTWHGPRPRRSSTTGRVVLSIQPGIAVTGPAVSDVVHLLAELIENATLFSPTDTAVQVSGHELTSGGVLIEITDKGIGIPEERLAEMNWRLQSTPVIDVSVSRHMGLFAVARLAERHGVQVRLRPASPQGLSALVWLPDTVIEHTAPVRRRAVAAGAQGGGGIQGRRSPGQHRHRARGHGRPARERVEDTRGGLVNAGQQPMDWFRRRGRRPARRQRAGRRGPRRPDLHRAARARPAGRIPYMAPPAAAGAHGIAARRRVGRVGEADAVAAGALRAVQRPVGGVEQFAEVGAVDAEDGDAEGDRDAHDRVLGEHLDDAGAAPDPLGDTAGLLRRGAAEQDRRTPRRRTGRRGRTRGPAGASPRRAS